MRVLLSREGVRQTLRASAGPDVELGSGTTQISILKNLLMALPEVRVFKRGIDFPTRAIDQCFIIKIFLQTRIVCVQ